MALYKSYMPFVKNGGVYVPTPNLYDIGNEVFLMIKLPDLEGKAGDRLSVVGKVVWINRSNSPTKPAGVGLQFAATPEGAAAKDQIERLVVGIRPDTPTYTI